MPKAQKTFIRQPARRGATAPGATGRATGRASTKSSARIRSLARAGCCAARCPATALFSIIAGPPGSGKTTLARIVAETATRWGRSRRCRPA
ncbi:MAG: AAA family ATPase [Kouleothrix sp.]